MGTWGAPPPFHQHAFMCGGQRVISVPDNLFIHLRILQPCGYIGTCGIPQKNGIQFIQRQPLWPGFTQKAGILPVSAGHGLEPGGINARLS